MVGSTHFADEETGTWDKDDSQGCSTVATGLEPRYLPLNMVPWRANQAHCSGNVHTCLKPREQDGDTLEAQEHPIILQTPQNQRNKAECTSIREYHRSGS